MPQTMKTKIKGPQVKGVALRGPHGNESTCGGNLLVRSGESGFSTEITRRHFLRGSAAAAAGLALGGLPSAIAAPRNRILPRPNKSGIEHIVLLMMENRSFDH